MGYSAQPFAVDLELVRQALGSGDRALLERAKNCRAYSTYRDQMNSDFDERLTDLIVRYVKPEAQRKSFWPSFTRKQHFSLPPEHAYEYGYALLTICDCLGTFLSPNGDTYYAGEAWKEVNGLFKEKGIRPNLDRMWETEQLFDIPAIAEFPVISHYSKNEIAHLLIEFEKFDIDPAAADKDSPYYDEVQELLYEFRESLRICQNKNVEWVSFLH